MINRVILIVMDSVGIGSLPDAKDFGDEGSNTVGNIKKAIPNMELPNLVQLGLGNIDPTLNIGTISQATGCFGKAVEVSPGKDTTTGHWEIAGKIQQTAFPTFPNGFPKDFLDLFEEKIESLTLGNIAASGTEIINNLGEAHLSTGYPIVYTSADSVFQIAAHEESYGLDKLYEICQIARALLKDEWAVGRVIARPFIGNDRDTFERTTNRRDFSLQPGGNTMLTNIKDAGMEVYAVGKMSDIYAGEGVTQSVKTKNNMEGVDQTINSLSSVEKGMILTNLVDFDMHYGHRNDPEGYANALMEFDQRIPELIDKLEETDALIITADHGCDPTFPGTDHTREYVPILTYGKQLKGDINLSTRNSFADIGATITDLLGAQLPHHGTSFKNAILN